MLSGLFANCAVLFFSSFYTSVLILPVLLVCILLLLPYVMSACMLFIWSFYVSLYAFIIGQKLFRAYVKILFQCRIKIKLSYVMLCYVILSYLILSYLILQFWGPFPQTAYACRNSTTVANMVLFQILDLISVSSKEVT